MNQYYHWIWNEQRQLQYRIGGAAAIAEIHSGVNRRDKEYPFTPSLVVGFNMLDRGDVGMWVHRTAIQAGSVRIHCPTLDGQDGLERYESAIGAVGTSGVATR